MRPDAGENTQGHHGATAPQPYAELCTTSNFTFLRGASHPEELVTRAAELGLTAIAITDRNSVAGVVRAYSALKELARLRDDALAAQATVQEGPEIRSQRVMDHSSRQTVPHFTGETGAPTLQGLQLPKLIPGARLVLTDSAVDWLALPTDLAAWSRLTRLLSLGKRRAPKGECHLTRADVQEWGKGMVLIALPPDPMETREANPGPVRADIQHLARSFPGQCFLGAAPAYDGRDQSRLDHLADLAQRVGIAMVAVGDVLMHRAARRPLADVLTCLRLGLTIDNIGRHRLTNGEHRLKSGTEQARLYHRYPAALRRTVEIADRCAFRLDDLRYQYPDEARDGEPAQARLERLAREGLHWRYPAGPPPKIVHRVQKELQLIAEIAYAPYFLTVHDIVQFARSKGILCQGRGSAANSVVCYLLGVTEVPPESITLIFERFISKERGEPPDIDVDFEHERREEVIQWIYDRYTRDRAGLTATVIHFRSRAAIREVGKVMGLSQDVVARLSGQIWGWSSSAPDEDRMRDAGLDAADRRIRLTLQLIGEIIGFPRHLSQHVGGFVITQGRLDELCPIENAAMDDRTVIEWDKDDIDALGLLKVDILALGMLTCHPQSLRICLTDFRGQNLTLANVPPEDPRGLRHALPRRCHRDVSGGKSGAVELPAPDATAQILRSGVRSRHRPTRPDPGRHGPPLHQPPPGQGEGRRPWPRDDGGVGPHLWRAVVPGAGDADRRRRRRLHPSRGRPIAPLALPPSSAWAPSAASVTASSRGMLSRGYDADFADRCFAQIEGFGSYGFPESHAASFARLVYISAWLKCHHQAIFTCALLNSQPMGFYAPAQLVRDARDHGVEVRPVSVNHSFWDCTIEPRPDGALALATGVSPDQGHARGRCSVDHQPRAAMAIRMSKACGAEQACNPTRWSGWPRRMPSPPLGLTRRDALWDAKALRADPHHCRCSARTARVASNPPSRLPQMTLGARGDRGLPVAAPVAACPPDGAAAPETARKPAA